MKMKKNLVLVIFMIMVFMAGTLPALANSAQDYKVIKKSGKGKTVGDIHWFKLSVYDKKAKKDTVTLKVPITLVEMFADCAKEDTELNKEVKKHCGADIKKILQVLKENGPMTLLEVDEEDELVKIWFE